MAAKAVLDLISKDSRFLASMSRVRRAVAGVEARMAGVASSAKRMLLIGGAAIAGFLVLAGQQVAAETKLEAVLKATGNAAGLSAEQLKAHAAAIQDITGVGDEAVIAMQAILATFKHIKGDEFRRATESIVDMAAVLGTDLSAAAIQVGKALNDPIRGVSMLSRSGITFSEVQLKMIKSLAKAGDMMGAQRIVLKELESQFGGTAEAIGKTFVGSMKKAKSAIGDVGEGIGGVFIPFIMKMADAVTSSKEGILTWVNANKTLILGITGTAAALAMATIGIHLMTKVILATTLAVKGLTIAFAFLSAHPIIAALAVIAAGITGLILLFRDAKGATDDWSRSIDELAASNKELSLQIANVREERELDVQAAERELVFAEERQRLLEGEKRRQKELLKLREDMRKEPAREKERLEFIIRRDVARRSKPRGLQQPGPLMGPPQPEPSWMRLPWAGGPSIFKHIGQLREILGLKKETQSILKRMRATWAGLREASERVNVSLDNEAARIKSMILSDKERLAIELKRVALLQAAGKLTAEEAAKAREKLATEERGVASIEDAASMFRRIQAAAGGRRADPSATPQQQTATSTTKTATEMPKIAEQTRRSTVTLGEIFDLLKGALDGGPKVQGVYGS